MFVLKSLFRPSRPVKLSVAVWLRTSSCSPGRLCQCPFRIPIQHATHHHLSTNSANTGRVCFWNKPTFWRAIKYIFLHRVTVYCFQECTFFWVFFKWLWPWLSSVWSCVPLPLFLCSAFSKRQIVSKNPTHPWNTNSLLYCGPSLKAITIYNLLFGWERTRKIKCQNTYWDKAKTFKKKHTQKQNKWKRLHWNASSVVFKAATRCRSWLSFSFLSQTTLNVQHK